MINLLANVAGTQLGDGEQGNGGISHAAHSERILKWSKLQYNVRAKFILVGTRVVRSERMPSQVMSGVSQAERHCESPGVASGQDFFFKNDKFWVHFVPFIFFIVRIPSQCIFSQIFGRVSSDSFFHTPVIYIIVSYTRLMYTFGNLFN